VRVASGGLRKSGYRSGKRALARGLHAVRVGRVGPGNFTPRLEAILSRINNVLMAAVELNGYG
jgi:hypothetical protein